MYAWLKENRQEAPSASGVAAPKDASPVPDGAMMIKEMYPYPAAACAGIEVTKLLPLSQASAVMVRDSKASHDGWFWGWYGWGPTESSGWAVDWPAPQSAPYPRMGFGQYCTNCHASAKDNQTFAALKNIQGEPGEPLVFLSQNFFLDPSWKSLANRIQEAGAKDAAASGNDPPYNNAFIKTFWTYGGPPPREMAWLMPPETYDNVWARHGDPTFKDQFLTSDQCIGCHSAGGTGLQYDMTQPGPNGKLACVRSTVVL